MTLACPTDNEYYPEPGACFWLPIDRTVTKEGHQCCECGKDIEPDPDEKLEAFTHRVMPEYENGDCLARPWKTKSGNTLWPSCTCEGVEQSGSFDGCQWPNWGDDCPVRAEVDEDEGIADPDLPDDIRCFDCTCLSESLQDAGWAIPTKGNLFGDHKEYVEVHKEDLEVRKNNYAQGKNQP